MKIQHDTAGWDTYEQILFGFLLSTLRLFRCLQWVSCGLQVQVYREWIVVWWSIVSALVHIGPTLASEVLLRVSHIIASLGYAPQGQRSFLQA